MVACRLHVSQRTETSDVMVAHRFIQVITIGNCTQPGIGLSGCFQIKSRPHYSPG